MIVVVASFSCFPMPQNILYPIYVAVVHKVNAFMYMYVYMYVCETPVFFAAILVHSA